MPSRTGTFAALSGFNVIAVYGISTAQESMCFNKSMEAQLLSSQSFSATNLTLGNTPINNECLHPAHRVVLYHELTAVNQLTSGADEEKRSDDRCHPGDLRFLRSATSRICRSQQRHVLLAGVAVYFIKFQKVKRGFVVDLTEHEVTHGSPAPDTYRIPQVANHGAIDVAIADEILSQTWCKSYCKPWRRPRRVPCGRPWGNYGGGFYGKKRQKEAAVSREV